MSRTILINNQPIFNPSFTKSTVFQDHTLPIPVSYFTNSNFLIYKFQSLTLPFPISSQFLLNFLLFQISYSISYYYLPIPIFSQFLLNFLLYQFQFLSQFLTITYQFQFLTQFLTLPIPISISYSISYYLLLLTNSNFLLHFLLHFLLYQFLFLLYHDDTLPVPTCKVHTSTGMPWWFDAILSVISLCEMQSW